MLKFFRLYNSEKGENKSEEMLWLFQTIKNRIKVDQTAKSVGVALMFRVYFDFGFAYITESSEGT